MFLLKKKVRLLSVASLLFLSQCCCIVLPLRAQVRQDPSPIREIVQKIERFLPDQWSNAGWFNAAERAVSK